MSPALLLQLLLEMGFFCIHSVLAVCFSSYLCCYMYAHLGVHTCSSCSCIPKNDKRYSPVSTATILQLCLFRHKCYTLPCSFLFQSMRISSYFLKVFLLKIKKKQNKLMKFFSVTKISIFLEALPTCVSAGFNQQNLYSSTCMSQVVGWNAKENHCSSPTSPFLKQKNIFPLSMMT